MKSGAEAAKFPPAFQSPLSRGTTPDEGDKCYFAPTDIKFQSPLSRGTTPDWSSGLFFNGAHCPFQSPLSRGTTPDYLDSIAEIEPQKEKFQSPLSRGTTPDAITFLKEHQCGSWFQSPLSRGTTPDNHCELSDLYFRMFQSPLSRGTTPDPINAGSWHPSFSVSIPSKSGHYSRPIMEAIRTCLGCEFQSPLSRGTPPNGTSTCVLYWKACFNPL